MTTVALDAHGVDAGPEVIVAGARAAAEEGIRVRVFGAPAELAGLEDTENVELVSAEQGIANEEEPVRAVRSKPGASIVRAAADVAAGSSDALVSAGSTGAAMAAALFALKRMRGVHRPALAAQLSPPGGRVLFLDVGANAEARVQHLVQFAYMGAAFSRAVLGVDQPRVALLSNGEEPGKGTQVVVEAHEELAQTQGIHFIGNVEGRDIPAGVADVIVTDGFTGNVALKLMEGTARAVSGAIRGAARSNPISMVGGLLLAPSLGGLRRDLDPNATGGAIMLGLRGVAVIGHGSSSGEGIANAVRLAARAVQGEAIERTEALLEAGGVLRKARRRPRSEASRTP